jgi:hypothetical protein
MESFAPELRVQISAIPPVEKTLDGNHRLISYAEIPVPFPKIFCPDSSVAKQRRSRALPKHRSRWPVCWVSPWLRMYCRPG